MVAPSRRGDEPKVRTTTARAIPTPSLCQASMVPNRSFIPLASSCRPPVHAGAQLRSGIAGAGRF